jgi:hypothetical protein
MHTSRVLDMLFFSFGGRRTVICSSKERASSVSLNI